MTIDVKVKVPVERAYDMVVGAIEGGSVYWLGSITRQNPAAGGESYYKDSLWNKERESDPSYIHICEVPFQRGGSLICEIEADNDDPANGTKHELDFLQVQQGLHVMAEKYPQHFADMLSGNDDATTADVFLQCALLGDVIYG